MPVGKARRSAWQLTLVVVAILAVVFGTWYVMGDLRSSGRPTASPSATSSRTASPAPTRTAALPPPLPMPTGPVPTPKWAELPQAQLKVDIDLEALDQGPAPRVPWYAEGVIHDGEQTTPIRHGLPDHLYEVLRFRRLEGGYAVDVSQPDGGGHWTAVIDRQGGVVREVAVQAASHDGRYVAWTEGSGVIPIVHDMRTGKVVRGQARRILSLDGFVGAKVLYTTRVGRELGGLALWDPATDTDEPISPYVSGAEQADEDVTAVSAMKENQGGSCFGIYSIQRRELLSRLCRIQYPVRDSPYVAWSDAGKFVVFDARTGKGLLELRTTLGDITDVMREPGGALLVKVSGPNDAADLAEDGTRAALVRCTLSGECELATKIYPQTDPAVFNTLLTLPS